MAALPACLLFGDACLQRASIAAALAGTRRLLLLLRGPVAVQAALLGFGSMAAALPFTSLVYLLVCGVWLNATLSLARTMEEQEQEKTVRRQKSAWLDAAWAGELAGHCAQ